MKLHDLIRKALPCIVAVVVFFAVSAIYFAPQFSGDTIAMNDVTQYRGGKADISAHRAEFGEDPQWTGGMFGGMPAYLITVRYPAMVLRNTVQWGMNLVGEPMALMFLAMLGFWLMLVMCRVNPWLAIPFALAYGLSTYNILIIEAGHITKMRAMGYAPMLVGAIFYTFKGKMWLGGALAAFFGTLLIAASHHQITYYFLLVIVALWINELVVTARARKEWRRFCIATGVLVAAAVLAVGANFTHLWYTLEHSPETTRGGSELVTEGPEGPAGASTGLDLDYATAWSYGTGESLNMLIPNLRGGSSWTGFEADGPVARVLGEYGASSLAPRLPGIGVSTYWGEQPGTGGPTYLGAVMVFLFVLGMFVLPARQKWWVLGVSVFALLLAWGRNAMWFTELSFAVLPGYNKFRTVAMALAVLQWSVPFVAALVASGLWRGEFSTGVRIAEGAEKKRFMRGLIWATGLTGGVALLFALFGGAIFDLTASGDFPRLVDFATQNGFPQAEANDFADRIIAAVSVERLALLKADSWRSLLFVALTAAVVWAWASRRSWQGGIRRLIPVAALSVLVLADLIPVDLRFLSHDDFSAPQRIEVTPDEADLEIMADPEPGFRVLNTQNPFNEAYTSHFHRSVGGYHAAKLRRYQDLIDRYLVRFHPGVLGMLNTKYFIVNDPVTGERTIEPNGDALGAAWFVDEYVWVDGPAAELEALDKTDLRHKAVVDERFRDIATAAVDATMDVDGISPDDGATSLPTENSTIELIEYRPNYLKYETLTAAAGVAVFSEIYYDKGWTAYLDGEPTPYFRADYILRAMVVPAGNHTIEWRFRAPRFALVEGVTLGCSIAVLLWIAAALFFERKRRSVSNEIKS